MKIRSEVPGDEGAIRRVISSAFGQAHEAELVDALRAAGDLVVSLVADADGEVCGHVAVPRLKSPPDAAALAPVSVSPHWQMRGIGTSLVWAALCRAKRLGIGIVFVVGDPRYYGRFGFSATTAEPFPSPYAGPHFMAKWLSEARTAPAEVMFSSAFDELE